MDFHKHIIRDTHGSSRKLVETFAFGAGRERQMGREKPRFYDEGLCCINIDLDQYGHRDETALDNTGAVAYAPCSVFDLSSVEGHK